MDQIIRFVQTLKLRICTPESSPRTHPDYMRDVFSLYRFDPWRMGVLYQVAFRFPRRKETISR